MRELLAAGLDVGVVHLDVSNSLFRRGHGPAVHLNVIRSSDPAEFTGSRTLISASSGVRGLGAEYNFFCFRSNQLALASASVMPCSRALQRMRFMTLLLGMSTPVCSRCCLLIATPPSRRRAGGIF